jgi:hypothetical protein
MVENLPWRLGLSFSRLPGPKLNFMAKKDFTILNKLGIHARPAAQFVKMANRFKCDIMVTPFSPPSGLALAPLTASTPKANS